MAAHKLASLSPGDQLQGARQTPIVLMHYTYPASLRIILSNNGLRSNLDRVQSCASIPTTALQRSSFLKARETEPYWIVIAHPILY